jgi:hypothetical protein
MSQDSCDDNGYTSSTDSHSVVKKTETPVSQDNSHQQSDSPNPRWYESTSHWIAIFTAILTIATIFQWRTSITTHRTSERAWVTVKEAKIHGSIEIGITPMARINFQNSGHSPALHATIRQTIKMLDKLPTGPMEVINYAGDESNGVIGPESISSSDLHLGESLSDAHVLLLKRKDRFLVTYGYITYFDIFGIPHETRFCFIMLDTNSDGLSPCNKWNEAD